MNVSAKEVGMTVLAGVVYFGVVAGAAALLFGSSSHQTMVTAMLTACAWSMPLFGAWRVLVASGREAFWLLFMSFVAGAFSVASCILLFILVVAIDGAQVLYGAHTSLPVGVLGVIFYAISIAAGIIIVRRVYRGRKRELTY